MVYQIEAAIDVTDIPGVSICEVSEKLVDGTNVSVASFA